ncbi:MAG: hypothetical protein PUP92_21215 [Rhizonema sp. PD38]|nr:hypothetical protein [Rhizonema sp. PD38]
MTETALDRFWELVISAIALKSEAFVVIQTLPLASKAALYIVLLAWLSQSIGQGIVLYINRVKPIRFILSLLIASVLFAVTAGCWSLSAWLVSCVLYNAITSYEVVWSTLGLAYAPLILGFLVALPYLGVPIQVLLSIWTLLALTIGLHVTLHLGIWQASWCGMLGWIIFQILQRNIGFAKLSKWVSIVPRNTQVQPQISSGINQTHVGNRDNGRV